MPSCGSGLRAGLGAGLHRFPLWEVHHGTFHTQFREVSSEIPKGCLFSQWKEEGASTGVSVDLV